jgi:hypothetical protein
MVVVNQKAARVAMVAAALVVVAVGAGLVVRRLRPDPAREMMTSEVPAWQTARFRGQAAAGRTAQALFARARRWPDVAAGFQAMDRAWPGVEPVRAAAKSVNRALAAARLPYFVDVQQVGADPIALSYELIARVPWRIGARTVDVLRLRRLDALNIEMGMYGATDQGLPVVLLDRIEATLAGTLPAMYGHAGEAARQLNDFDRAALARERGLLEARLGPGLAAAAGELAERDRLLEEMRTRLNGGALRLNPPDGFVLGDRWLEDLEPYTQFDRGGPPLLFDTDLRAVTRADEKLRSGETARLLAAAVDIMAAATEAHEARHALDEVDLNGPPPPTPLFEVMGDSSTQFIGLADAELRAYLGELHDTGSTACWVVAKMLRGVYGRGARRTPHFYAIVTIMGQLDPEPERAPAARLALLCDLPDAELRARVATAWQKLYGTALPAGQRAGAR